LILISPNEKEKFDAMDAIDRSVLKLVASYKMCETIFLMQLTRKNNLKTGKITVRITQGNEKD
jgi:hypothetical protein